MQALHALPARLPASARRLRVSGSRCSASASARPASCGGARPLARRGALALPVLAPRGRAGARASRGATPCVRASAGKELVQDGEKSITKASGGCSAFTRPALRLTLAPRLRRAPQVSFGTIGLSVGLTLLSAGFLGYFNFIKGSDNSLSALLLIYGFPISLIGTACAGRGAARNTRRQACA
jgi:hypothetical protein